MKFWPSVLARERSTLRTGSVTAAQPVRALETDVAGGIGAGQIEAVLPSVGGRPGLTGSPPPPTRARLVTALEAPFATATSMVIVAVPPTGIAVVLVQTTFGGVETHAKPLGDVKPVNETKAGSTSTTRIVPLLGCEPRFATVSV